MGIPMKLEVMKIWQEGRPERDLEGLPNPQYDLPALGAPTHEIGALAGR